jgi:hypothetical protein
MNTPEVHQNPQRAKVSPGLLHVLNDTGDDGLGNEFFHACRYGLPCQPGRTGAALTAHVFYCFHGGRR